jgi:hypothetical protein
MRLPESWRRDHVLWVEVFAASNFAFLTLDIYMAHSVNSFRNGAEYIPLYFSAIAAGIIAAAIAVRGVRPRLWNVFGHAVGWASMAVGLAGVVLHLDSSFFVERTLKSLTYAAPFAAPLAYAGLGLLLVMDRMVDARSKEWSLWVLLLALGGFAGNFVLSLTDHAVNGFFRWAEWIPVISSAYAVGFLITPFLTKVTRPYLSLCGFALLAQAAVGVAGFCIHAAANVRGPSTKILQNFIDGAPTFAPLLFPNLSVLAAIGLWVLSQQEVDV